MTLTIQRDVLAALGDTDALAKFDHEHQQALAQEQAARVKATQQVLEGPLASRHWSNTSTIWLDRWWRGWTRH